jgi:hypothetical protein
MKNCRICNQDKPITDFFKDPGYSDGRRAWCKACEYVKRKGYRKTAPVQEGFFDVDAWAKTELWQPSVHTPDAAYKRQYRKRKAA